MRNAGSGLAQWSDSYVWINLSAVVDMVSDVTSKSHERRKLIQRLQRKIRRGSVEIRYLFGDDAPAHKYYRHFKLTATKQPVPGLVGPLRGHGSQTVVVDFDLISKLTKPSRWGSGNLVLKFEIYPGDISFQRFVSENQKERLARTYLDQFMPATLRVIGHGLNNEPSILTYQKRVAGRTLRNVSWREISTRPSLCEELIQFCDAVLVMSQKTRQIPDIAGTLPRVDHLSNIFRLSRNIVVDLRAEKVWLVDTGWKDGQESLIEGSLRSRWRTRFRLYSMQLYRWRLNRKLKGSLFI